MGLKTGLSMIDFLMLLHNLVYISGVSLTLNVFLVFYNIESRSGLHVFLIYEICQNSGYIFLFVQDSCSAMLIHIYVKFLQKRRTDMERQFRPKEFELEDAKKLLSSVANAPPDSTLDELHQEISVRL